MISSTGTLKATGKGGLRLEVRRTNGYRMASFERLIEIFSDLPWAVSDFSSGANRVTYARLQGEALQPLLEALWPYFDDDRKLELIMGGSYDAREGNNAGSEKEAQSGTAPHQ